MLSIYRTLRLSLIISVIAITSPAFAGGDAAQGKILADTCKGCHAVDSYTNVYPTYHVPRIAGQNADYLVSALKLYRDGNRDHPTMTAQAASFADQDIQDIAAYLAAAGTEPDPAAAPKGEAPTAALVCAACHGSAGVSTIPSNPNLAGQHLDYLQQAIAQYKSGGRKGPNAIAMQAQLNAISDEDLQAVLGFFAAQDGLQTLDMSD
jgi:cytochrome c553